MIIKSLAARKILASFGNYTVEAIITFENETESRASVPAGISAGKYEVVKAEPDLAIDQISQINQIVSGKNWTQESLDKEISSHGFGGNSTLAVSAAFFKASHQFPEPNTFPKLMLLLFEGGKHGNPANRTLTIQEFAVLEDSISGADFTFKLLRDYLVKNSIETLVGAEGGFSPAAFNDTMALDTIKKVFPDKKICLDVAGSFGGDLPELSGIFSIEDPYDDEAWDKFVALTAQKQLLVVGDDLTTTNPERIKKAIAMSAVDAVVIKPNQIGTISAAFDAVKVARSGNLKIVVSHRGEETEDTWIVDFALTVKADYVKFGGMDRGERIAKYNRLSELGMA